MRGYLGDTIPFMAVAENEDGGHPYRACNQLPSTTAMTSAAINILRTANLPGSHPQVQRAMGWLRDNYVHDTLVAGNHPQSYYYALWSRAKAFELMEDTGAEGVWESDIGGTRNPVADGYPDEPRGWYYDFAHILVNTQTAAGNWPCDAPRRCWQTHAATAFAILVLQRSRGGICGDINGDEDGICQEMTIALTCQTLTRMIGTMMAWAICVTTVQTRQTRDSRIQMETVSGTPVTLTNACPLETRYATDEMTIAINPSTKETPVQIWPATPVNRACVRPGKQRALVASSPV